jgi:predicted nuclease of restriction endonuclease-like RecB superfamily
MPLAVKDVRFTTRRAGDGTVMLYPRLMRDRAILASIDVALQYFETLLGSARRELDPEALVHFFGDYKVARGMVASMGRVYRYQAPRLDHLVTRTAARRFQRAGIGAPGDLRVLLWDEANLDGSGFLVGERRSAVTGTLEGRLGLRTGELDRLLYLDAPEHAILSRLGAVPSPADVLAEYRRGVIAALLAQAERVDVVLERRATGHAEAIQALAQVERVDVDVTQESGCLRIGVRGQVDALGSWTRHGRRIARFVSRLLERTRPLVQDGSALIALRSKRARLRLTDEVLDAVAPSSHPAAGWESVPSWDDADVVEALRPGRALAPGWRVRRDPEARTWAAGILVPDLLIRQGSDATSGVLVCCVRSAAQAARLAALLPSALGGEPVLCVGTSDLVGPLRGIGAWTLEIDAPALPPILRAAAVRAEQVRAAQAMAQAARRRPRVA